MAIVQTVDFNSFRDAFKKAGCMDDFSYAGMQLLFNYLELLSEDIDEPVELDVIAYCCEYSEDTPEDIASNYDIDISEAEGDEDGIKEIVREYLENNTMIIGETSTGFVYVNF